MVTKNGTFDIPVTCPANNCGDQYPVTVDWSTDEDGNVTANWDSISCPGCGVFNEWIRDKVVEQITAFIDAHVPRDPFFRSIL